MKRITIILGVLLLPLLGYAQEDTTFLNFGEYKFNSTYDTANYCSVLTVTKNGNNIFTSECGEKIEYIKAIDIDGDGVKEILINEFTGGAHCCDFLLACSLDNDKFRVLDSLFLGNSGCEIKDINGDGKVEFTGVDDRYAYAFTNFAQSYFPVMVHQFKNKKFKDVTREFPSLVENDIKFLKGELKDYIAKGFDCPKAGEETFNTDAGAVKAILGPIVEDYSNLSKINDGYDYVKKIYKCNDAVNFINVLKNDFKLK